MFRLFPFFTLVILSFSLHSQAGTIKVAVASNFLSTAKALKSQFKTLKPEHTVKIISASTGQLSHQILNGAPFDLFLAANKQHPQHIQTTLNLPANHLLHYATGRLVLVSHKTINTLSTSNLDLKNLSALYNNKQPELISGIISQSKMVAIANHKLAPYGLASREVLTSLNLLNSLKDKTITGQNISQTHQFFSSKNVDTAFISKSQMIDAGFMHTENTPAFKTILNIKADLHNPIEQWAIKLTQSEANTAFINYLASDSAQGIIRGHGYSTPLNSDTGYGTSKASLVP